MTRHTDVDDVIGRLTGLSQTPPSTRAAAVAEVLREQVAGYPQTPMRVFDVSVAGRWRRIRLKLEGESPWRSVKGRTGIALIASLVSRLRDDTCLAESTSGNLGVALSGLCGAAGVAFFAVVDDRLPRPMERRMRACGADLVVADHRHTGGDRLMGRMRTVAAMTVADSRMLWTNQYDNPANPLVHEIWTGPELLAQAPSAQAVFVGVSTGGTLAGCARAVRARARGVKVVGVDVEGSRVFGGDAAPRVLTGIGASRVSSHVDRSRCDAVEVVSGWSAVMRCRAWKASTGLGLGGSSGAVLAAALRHLADHDELTDIVCLCPDLDDNYADTIYDDRWVADHAPDALTWQEERVA